MARPRAVSHYVSATKTDKSIASAVWLWALCVVCSSCTGQLDPSRRADDTVRGSTPNAFDRDPKNGAGGAAAAGQGGATATTAGEGGATPSCVQPSLSPSLMRRLTNAEYVRSARALLLTAPGFILNIDLPGESTVNNFENAAAFQTISEQHVSQYGAVADALAKDLMTTDTRLRALTGCAPETAPGAACLDPFIDAFGRRAFRRPLAPDEHARLLQLATNAVDPLSPYAGAVAAIKAMLASPKHWFIVENGSAGGAASERPDYRRLTAYEMATRLSLVLWGTTPDDMLLDAAQNGELDTPVAIDAVVQRMLVDDRTHQGQREFFAQWLRLRQLNQIQRDTKSFPSWNASLQKSMSEETYRFVEDLAWSSQQDFRDILTAGFTYVDPSLAQLYGLTPPSGTAWVRTILPPASFRSGLLTQASFLATSGNIGPKAITRGRLVREALLCTAMPMPPNDVPPLDATMIAPTASSRERLEAHRSNPSCASCHQFLDPVGFGLDQFDAIGALQTVDATGHAFDTHGQIAGFPAPDFQGPYELASKLRESSQFSNCLATQLFRFAAARPEGDDDTCALAQLSDEFARGGYRYQALLKALFHSDAFAHRNPLVIAP